MSEEATATSARAARRAGVLAGLGVPGCALFLTMTGFGAIARESGLTAWMALASTAFVWGMPGQVAFAELYTAGAGALVIFVAVALANLRMLPMTVVGLPMMALERHGLGFAGRCLVAHFLSVTGWAQLTDAERRFPRMAVFPYYTGFVAVLYSMACSGTVFGFYLSDMVPATVAMLAIYITPLYLFLLVSNARRVTNQWAVGLGAAVGPACYPLIGDWSIMAAGLIAGSAAMLIARRGEEHDA